MSMQKKIILHGHLAEKYSKEIVVEAETVAEAIRSLETIEELKPEDGSPWAVTIDGVDSEVALYARSHIEEIHVRPQMGGGGGRGGILQVLIGVALVAVGFMGGIPLIGLKASSLFLTGGLMITGGLLQMMIPTPDGSEETETSRYLGATSNTVKIGTRIVLGYGTRKLGGHYLSFDVDAVEYSPEDSGGGTEVTIEDSVYVEYDDQGVAPAPVLPIFASQTASPANVPTSGWISA